MEFPNETNFEFRFTGLAENPTQVSILFLFFLLVYLITTMGNSGMVTLVCTNSRFHSPMYFFLGYLSMVDLCYSSVITPKMLVDLVSNVKSISFKGCVVQFFFYVGLVVTESLLLSCMSYDRYVAICHPLHYTLIMTKKKCLQIILIVSGVGFLQSTVLTACIFSLRFCQRNQIDHFYCDVFPVMKLSCSETFSCQFLSISLASFSGLFSMVSVLVSYSLIVFTILWMNCAVSRRKAFSTCSSHLTCWTALFIYIRPKSSGFGKQDRIVAVFYTVVIPMLNPLIYSLRNQEVKKAIYKSMTNR
ncbi:hypothetical protein GDO86_019708, partial [Hymenochirus boettgeri]